MTHSGHDVRRATPADAAELAPMLHEFQVESDSPTPGADVLERRLADFLESGDVVAVIGGEGPAGSTSPPQSGARASARRSSPPDHRPFDAPRIRSVS